MDIGGIDIQFTKSVTKEDTLTLLYAVKERWPRARFQGDSDVPGWNDIMMVNDVLARGFLPVPSTWFVFASDEMRLSWNAHGLADDNKDGMIMIVIRGKEGADFVVGVDGGVGHQIVQRFVRMMDLPKE